MKKKLFTLICILSGLFPFTMQAQIISVTPGTDFSIAAFMVISADSIDLIPGADFTINGTTLSRVNAVNNYTAIPYIKRVYQFSAATNAFSGAIKMFYSNADLNGLSESGLKLLRHNGSSWSLDNGSSVNTTDKFIQNNAVSGTVLNEISAGVHACTPNTGDTTATACGSFVWYGTTYSSTAITTHTLTNVGGCDSVVTMHLTINALPAPASLSVTHPTCASQYGTIRVTSPVFFNSFNIDGTNFSNLTGVFSGLPAGTHQVWVKNASGCISAPTSITVNAQPATPVAPVVTLTQPTCTLSSGTIAISSNPGDNLFYSTNSFTYLNITGVFSGVVSGSYNVTSKNASGCISPSTAVVINARLAIPATPSATVTQPTCLLSTGNITVSSPSSAYAYGISKSGVFVSFNSNGLFIGLPSGTYSLTATSPAGCASVAKSLVLNAPPATPAAPTLLVTQPTTTLGTGTIKVTSTVMGNSFSTNGITFTNLTGVFSGLLPGTYNIYAKNSAGCISLPSMVTISSGLARGTETPAPVVVSILSIVPPAMASNLFEVGAYPNPTTTDFKLNISSASSETIKVTMYDMFGRVVKYFSFASKPSITLGQDLKPGVYMVELRQGKHVKSLKLVKF